MIRDLEADGLPEHDRCDVLVVGAGPAGIVVALELARRREDWRIILAEGGGRGPPRAEESDLYQGEAVGKSYPIGASRLRFLGGTSNHWGGWCRPLDAIDFESRPGLPLAAWPFGHDTLAPHYAVAHRWCEIASDDYDPAAVEARQPGTLLDLSSSSLFRNRLFRFSPPTRFGARYADDLESTSNLDVLLHANAVALARGTGRVDAVELRSLGGARQRVEATHVVLAMGGLETTRFVLNQADQHAGGVGLSSPWVGLCFADHFGLRPGAILAQSDLGYTRIEDESGPVMPIICPTDEAIRELGWRNVAMMLAPFQEDGVVGPDYAAQPALGFGDSAHWLYAVQMILEPAPDPESRVTLGSRRDALGARRLRLHWRLSRRDYQRAHATYLTLTRELGRMGLGRGRAVDPEIEERLVNARNSSHHMGSLRMAADPDEGVVDAHLRVHGEENLHVLGSATFPGYGFSNPTLTIVALAVRLAERLAGPDVAPRA